MRAWVITHWLFLLGLSLHEQGLDARSLLQVRILKPLGIPDHAWQISYGRRDRIDGVPMYAIGSGASLSPRAIAALSSLYGAEGRFREQWFFRKN